MIYERPKIELYKLKSEEILILSLEEIGEGEDEDIEDIIGE